MKSKNLLSDTDLVQACMNGDKRAQECLYKKYLGLVYHLSLRYSKTAEDATDSVQEVYIRIFKSLNQFDISKGTLKGWIAKIAVRTTMSWDRKFHTGREVSLNEKMAHTMIEDNQEAADRLAEVLIALSAMPPQLRLVFDLYVIDGFRHKEIADMLEITVIQSRVSLSRARQWVDVHVPHHLKFQSL